MRSTFRPKTFGGAFEEGSSERVEPWAGYPPEIAELLRSFPSISGRLEFSLFGSGPLLFPRLVNRSALPEPLRIGLFAGFDVEPAPALARLRDFPLELEKLDPDLARDTELRIYPACNPLAFLGAPEAQPGWHLRQGLWLGSPRGDVYYLERELGTHPLNGLFLIAADPSEPASVSASGPLLAEEVIRPVLERFHDLSILAAPWRADSGLLRGTDLRPIPFEIRINYPPNGPAAKERFAPLLAALIREYSSFLSFSDGL